MDVGKGAAADAAADVVADSAGAGGAGSGCPGEAPPAPPCSADLAAAAAAGNFGNGTGGSGGGSGRTASGSAKQALKCNEVEEMTMLEILQGKGDYFPGLIPLIYAYLEHISCDGDTFSRIDAYMSLITDRARGTVMTDADWIRDFITKHPDYAGDSVVGPATAHDLMVACDAVGRGALRPPELFGAAAAKIVGVRAEDAYGSQLVGEKLSRDSRAGLVRRLTGARPSRRERTLSEAQSGEAAEESQQKYLADMVDAAEAGLRDF